MTYGVGLIINSVITGIISIIACYFTMRYNLHMLQLNGYKNNEQRVWLYKNITKQKTLFFGIALGILHILLGMLRIQIILNILCIITDLYLIVVIVLFNFYKNYNVKKKLVFTARVVRLIATNVILVGIITVIVAMFVNPIFLIGILTLYMAFQPLFCIACNTLNKPVEQSVANHFINDAKNKLKEMPNLVIIGVTGSYGKTSVKFYLSTLLREHFNVLMTPGSYNTPMGVVRTIREQLKPTHEIFICEMGARYEGDIKEICDIVHPKHGIITSIGPQHLDTFGDIENIKKTKFELADAVLGKGILFLNGDNEFIKEKAEVYDNAVFYHDDSETNDYYAKNIIVSNLGTEFVAVTPSGQEELFKTRLVGRHNIINIMGAIAVADKLGIPLNELKIPVRRLEAAPHRLQLIDKETVTIIDDAYNSNPMGSKAAVETLSLFDGVRILITPGMVELGKAEDEYNKKFGEYAADCCDYILLVGEAHTVPIKEGAIQKGFDENKLKIFEHLEDALKFAYSINDVGRKYILLENDLPDNY